MVCGSLDSPHSFWPRSARTEADSSQHLLYAHETRSRTRTNGATQTFRRPSATSSFPQRDSAQQTPAPLTSSSSAYVPPHLISNHQSSSNRNGAAGECRYSKEQLTDIFKTQRAGNSIPDISELYVDGWSPNSTNGVDHGSWGRRDEQRDAPTADICWDHAGNVQPLSLTKMTDDERDVGISTRNRSHLLTPRADVHDLCEFYTEGRSQHEQGWNGSREFESEDLYHPSTDLFQFTVCTSAWTAEGFD